MNDTTHRTRWRIPKLTIYRVATPGTCFDWNDYSCGRIGAAVVLRSVCFSLVWKHP